MFTLLEIQKLQTVVFANVTDDAAASTKITKNQHWRYLWNQVENKR